MDVSLLVLGGEEGELCEGELQLGQQSGNLGTVPILALGPLLAQLLVLGHDCLQLGHDYVSEKLIYIHWFSYFTSKDIETSKC